MKCAVFSRERYGRPSDTAAVRGKSARRRHPGTAVAPFRFRRLFPAAVSRRLLTTGNWQLTTDDDH